MLGNGYVNAPIAGVELLSTFARYLAQPKSQKLPEQKAASALHCALHMVVLLSASGCVLSLSLPLSSHLISHLAKVEIICKCAKFWHNAYKPVNHTHAHTLTHTHTLTCLKALCDLPFEFEGQKLRFILLSAIDFHK